MSCDLVLRTCLLLAACACVCGQKYEGEVCASGPETFGECKKISACDSARVDIQNGKRPEICSYDRNVPIVCCEDSSIVASPVSSGPATQWPSENAAAPQRPLPTIRPTQSSADRPAQRPTQQRPPQRPTQRPTPQPTPPPSTLVATQSETMPTKKPSRPQWWQIPPRKKTESPADIDNPGTTPLSGFDSDQLPPRLQGTTNPPEPASDPDRIIFNKNGR